MEHMVIMLLCTLLFAFVSIMCILIKIDKIIKRVKHFEDRVRMVERNKHKNKGTVMINNKI